MLLLCFSTFTLIPGGKRKFNRMGVSQDKRHGFGFGIHLVADPDQIQIFRKTLGDSADAVRRQRARQSVVGRIGLFIRIPDRPSACPRSIQSEYPGGIGADSFAFLAFDLQLAVADRHFDAARHFDRFLPYSRHKAPFKFQIRDSIITNLESRISLS